MRLIDADAYLRKVCTYKETGCGSCKMQICCPVDQPTIEEHKKGEWERIPYSFIGGYRCSCCGCKSESNHWNFCPNCGADMRQTESKE